MPQKTFDDTKIRFATGAAGGVIAYRPNEILVDTGALPTSPADQVKLVNLVLNLQMGSTVSGLVGGVRRRLADLIEQLGALLGGRDEDDDERQQRVEELDSIVEELQDAAGGGQITSRPTLIRRRRINDRWSVLVPENGSDIDPVELSRLLKAAGVTAQPNYVRFINTLHAAPNYIAPNYIAPNYIAPNYIAPNYIAPNYIAPNYIAPNYIATRPGGDGGCQCGACPDAPDVKRQVPTITARRAYGPLPGPAATDLPGDLDVEIHVLDVRFQLPHEEDLPDFNRNATAYGAATLDEIGDDLRDKMYFGQRLEESPGASCGLLPLLLRVLESAKTDSDSSESFDDALGAFLFEAESEGRGANVDNDELIDPTTNHAEFIQGIIDRIVKAGTSSVVRHHAIAGTLGDVSDEDLARSIDWVVKQSSDSDKKKLRIMNLSLSGYTDDDLPPPLVAQSVAAAHDKGWRIVASAGNNGSCRLAWPAALKDVVSVAAYGPCGPAFFSNHGPWVDACGPGIGVVSNFTVPNNGELKLVDKPTGMTVGTEFIDFSDVDKKKSYASWSGTSFSAPYVAAMIALRVANKTAQGDDMSKRIDDAVAALITDGDLIRYPGYGTIVSEDVVRIGVKRESNAS